MKLDFDGVQAFVAVAELGGFSKAARELHITQTALTRRIQKLEAYLSLKLLERTTRRVEITPVGQEFLPRARSIVRELEDAIASLKDTNQWGRGYFTLACIPSLTSHFLPRLLAAYARASPANRVRLLDGDSNEVHAAILAGRAEVGLAIEGEKHPDLSQTKLMYDPLVFLCRSPHPMEHRKSLTWADMRELSLIGVSSFTATRVFMDYQLAKRGIRLQGDYEVRHHATALNLVAAGVGSAILPSSTFREGDRAGVCKIPLIAPVVKRKLVLLRSARRGLSPPAEAFITLLRKHPPAV